MICNGATKNSARPSWGTMRQKMAIFTEGNSVWRVHFFQEISFYIQKEMNSWGRCVRKWRFSKQETAFAGLQFFSGAKIATHLRIRVLNVKTRILTNLLISSSFLGDGESEILCAFLPVSLLFFLLVLLLPVKRRACVEG